MDTVSEVRDDNHYFVLTVWHGLSARRGAGQKDTGGMISLHQSLDGLSEYRIVG